MAALGRRRLEAATAARRGAEAARGSTAARDCGGGRTATEERAMGTAVDFVAAASFSLLLVRGSNRGGGCGIYTQGPLVPVGATSRD